VLGRFALVGNIPLGCTPHTKKSPLFIPRPAQGLAPRRCALPALAERGRAETLSCEALLLPTASRTSLYMITLKQFVPPGI
jgi:hypothetical protein